MLTPNLPAYAVALRLWSYPRSDWPWLVDCARWMHQVCQEQIDYSQLNRDCFREFGKPLSALTAEDVDGS